MSAVDFIGALASVLGSLGAAAVTRQLRRDAEMGKEAKIHIAKLQDAIVARTSDPEVLARHLFDELGEIEVSAYSLLPELRQRVELTLAKVETIRIDTESSG